MTHKCFKCDEKFPTSGKMVQHMRQAHSSFVEDAQMKIDRSQEISLEAKKTSEHYVATAKCPFCMVDCITRRKLMHHLNVQHQDEDDADDEPELKVIRVENDTDKKLLGELRKEQNDNGLSTANKSSIVNDLLNALDSNEEEKKELSLPGASGTIRVSATSIKLSEKRYRCFWCDASFRKRGKLMDHIDMFHKANKHQSEIEAELLVATTIGPAVPETPPAKPAPSSSQTKKSSTSSTASKSQPQKLGGKRRTTSSKKSSKAAAIENDLPDMVNTGVCSFIRSASITEVSRKKHVRRSIPAPIKSGSYNCTFFGSKDPNPIPPMEDDEVEVAEVEEPIQELPAPSPPVYHSDDSTQQVIYPYNEFNRYSSAPAVEACVSFAYPPLHRPQALYPPIYNSTIQFYNHQVAVNNHVRTNEPPTHPSNYHHQTNALLGNLPTFRHNPESPLDLTVARF